MNIVELLRKGSAAAREDSRTFLRWERKEMSTAECIDWFKYHNKCRGKDIPEHEFETFLNSLWYKR